MVHSFKIGGRRLAFDSASGELFEFGELAYKMLDYIGLPMPKDCPSALRYDLAKYDSAAIEETYDELYALAKAGKIFVEAEADYDYGTVQAAKTLTGLRDAPLDDELSVRLKAMEKAAKDAVKNGGETVGVRLGGGSARCEGCWAKKLCSRALPDENGCEIERKFIECALYQSRAQKDN